MAENRRCGLMGTEKSEGAHVGRVAENLGPNGLIDGRRVRGRFFLNDVFIPTMMPLSNARTSFFDVAKESE